MRSDLWDQAGGGLGPLDLPDPFVNLLVQGGCKFTASLYGIAPLLGAGLAWTLGQVAQGWDRSSAGYS